MNPENFERYLTDRYQDQVSWYQKKAAINKRYYQIFQWGVILLSAAVPVLVALKSEDQTRVWWATIIISTLLAIGTTGIKTFKFQENWTNYRSTSERLIQEKIFFDAGIGEYSAAESRETLFVRRVEALISDEGATWFESQKPTGGTSG